LHHQHNIGLANPPTTRSKHRITPGDKPVFIFRMTTAGQVGSTSVGEAPADIAVVRVHGGDQRLLVRQDANHNINGVASHAG
jgi:hypothetical protein